ncbi:MAG: tRNA uridine-5-carboxymethylaminomethyl(34) synthesis GTPase MnmE [Elusimicrobia bacterium]|nr:tRNA uridine-5-carboxymethylaminomethyl(34) synthesis GTPase MnmE [Elusimicrobiota bacterium]
MRLSGPDAFAVAGRFFQSNPGIEDAQPRQALFGKIQDAQDAPSLIDWVIAVKYAAPKSYTGEHMVEIISHGSPIILKKILALSLAHGAREALPGEFTQQAFINGKIDLVQAEAVCQLIRASSERASRLHAQIVSGVLSARIRSLADALASALAVVEALIDHPEETDIAAGVNPQRLAADVEKAKCAMNGLINGFLGARKIKEGLTLALVGSPNAGKSTLFNALLADDRSIVSPEPGTTRDTVEEALQINGHLVRLIDTAGWRKAQGSIEAMGLERTRRAIRRADGLLWIKDGCSAPDDEQEKTLERAINEEHKPFFIIWNKKDKPGFNPGHGNAHEQAQGSAAISALHGDGLNELRLGLASLTESAQPKEGEALVTEERQAQLLQCAHEDAAKAIERIKREEFELASLDLRHALADTHAILGAGDVAEEILAQIFSKFCIGK